MEYAFAQHTFLVEMRAAFRYVGMEGCMMITAMMETRSTEMDAHRLAGSKQGTPAQMTKGLITKVAVFTGE